MDIKAILDSMLVVAKAAAPIIGHGAPEMIELGERIVEMIDHTKNEFEEEFGDVDEEMEALLVARADLEQRVNAHVDRTVGKLRGE